MRRKNYKRTAMQGAFIAAWPIVYLNVINFLDSMLSILSVKYIFCITTDGF